MRTMEQIRNKTKAFLRKAGLSTTGPVAESGMSLIEIIIVIALIGTLMTYIIRNVLGTAETAKIDQTKIAFGVIQQSLQLYKIHNNKYPTTEQGLKALLENPGDVKTWRGPYIEENKLKDPWQMDFKYEATGNNYKIISGGTDGEIGTSDDIVYPESKEGAAGG